MIGNTKCLAAVAIAMTLLAGACGSGSDADVDAATIADEPVSSVSQPTPIPPPENSDEPVVFEADATPLVHEFGLVEVGGYRVDALGTPFTFSTDELLFVQLNWNGMTVLTAPSSRGPDDRDIVMMRISALSDPAAPTTEFENYDSGWLASDFDGWLEGLDDRVVVSNREATTLGGLDAVRVDLQLGDIECDSSGHGCAYLATNNLNTVKALWPGSSYRIWIVDQGTYAPLAVIVGIDSDQKSDWFDTAATVLSTMAFGEIAPNPLVVRPAGPAELPLLGGIRIELRQRTVVTQDPRGFFRLPFTNEPAHVVYLMNPLDDRSEPFESIDDLMEFMAGKNVDVRELSVRSIDGFEVRVFDISNSGQEAELKLLPDEVGWFSPPVGRWWLLEHPERGLLIISAEAYGPDPDKLIELSIAEAEATIASLTFIDAG